MNTSESTIRVWDPIVRIGHWLTVVAFFIAYLTEDDYLTQHVWAGYVVFGVVTFRILWGFIGSRHARFSDFVRPPGAVLAYLRGLLRGQPEHYTGHNPAGGAMVLALLACLTATGVSGFVLYAIEEDAGPLAGIVNDSGTQAPGPLSDDRLRGFGEDGYEEEEDEDDEYGEEREYGEYGYSEEDEDREEFWEEVHEVFANLTLLLVILHVLGVLVSSRAHQENLIKAMFTGRKQRQDPEV